MLHSKFQNLSEKYKIYIFYKTNLKAERKAQST